MHGSVRLKQSVSDDSDCSVQHSDRVCVLSLNRVLPSPSITIIEQVGLISSLVKVSVLSISNFIKF